MRGEIGQRYREAYGEDVVAKVGGEGLFPDVRTRIKWDEEGIIAILKDLGYGPGLPGRVYFTGFSGGGFLSWCMILRHPELFAGVVPVCPNFAWWTVSSDDASSGTRTTRVRVLRGQSDPLRSCRARGVPVPPLGVTLAFAPILGAGAGYVAWLRWKRVGRVAAVVLLVAILTTGLCVGRMSGLDFQADRAAALMAAVGQPVEWEEIPGMGHDAAPVRVLEVVADWERQQPGHSSQ
jgi:pimeloyl-ACP methyl ester carboxylesterase